MSSPTNVPCADTALVNSSMQLSDAELLQLMSQGFSDDEDEDINFAKDFSSEGGGANCSRQLNETVLAWTRSDVDALVAEAAEKRALELIAKWDAEKKAGARKKKQDKQARAAERKQKAALNKQKARERKQRAAEARQRAADKKTKKSFRAWLREAMKVAKEMQAIEQEKRKKAAAQEQEHKKTLMKTAKGKLVNRVTTLEQNNEQLRKELVMLRRVAKKHYENTRAAH